MHTLFVYGTLRKGGSQHERMRNARFLAEATVSGLLYEIDWYPGVVLDESQRYRVHGELYQVSDELLTELDDFEGPEYRRVKQNTLTTKHEMFSAWIWEYARPTTSKKIIASGDWLQR
jgi:gamma-glutamylcyclotransferase (GGCT)/AIG2-like uncharacterized protein YtfP